MTNACKDFEKYHNDKIFKKGARLYAKIEVIGKDNKILSDMLNKERKTGKQMDIIRVELDKKHF